MANQYKFNLGQKVIVNTGGKDSIAIIDWTRFPLRTHEGETRIYQMEYSSKNGRVIEYAYCCRFTDDPKHTLYGGAVAESHDEKNFMARSSQFIPESEIKPFIDYFGDK